MNHYDYDVFLSYAQMDNVPIFGEDEGWITRLHRDLEALLRQKTGSVTASVWRDQLRLEAGVKWAEEITDSLRASRILVPIVSPLWNKRPYCKKELKEFNETASTAGNKTRIVPLLFECLKNEPGQLPVTDFPPSLGVINLSLCLERRTLDANYKDVVNALATTIARRIETLTDSGVFPSNTVSPTTPEVVNKIFLAHAVGKKMRDIRTEVYNELINAGYEIEDAIADDDGTAEALVSETRAIAKSCLAAVHFVGEAFGSRLESSGKDDRPIVQIQFEAIRDCPSGPLQIVWPEPSLVPEKLGNEKQKSFIRDLQNGPKIKYWHESIETFKSNLIRTLNELTSPVPPAPGKDGFVYLLFESGDHDIALRIRQCIVTMYGREVLFPKQDGNARELLKDHQQTLKASQFVFIYHAQAPDSYTDNKHRECVVAKASRGSKPLSGGVVYFGPQQSKSKDDFLSPKFRVVRNYETGFDPEDLKGLF